MSRRPLPIGINNFPEIRKKGFAYVDKTAQIYSLLTSSSKAFYLSRPPRFGKSLLCSTIQAVLEGRRELFGEIAGSPALAINSLDWDWQEQPVIVLDLCTGVQPNSAESIHSALSSMIKREATRHGIVSNDDDNCMNTLTGLLTEICEKTGRKAAIIVDGCDALLLGNRTDNPAIQGELTGVFSLIKSYDAYLNFVFFTGETVNAPASVFPDSDQLVDISFDSRFATICGFTETEATTTFAEEIVVILTETNREYQEYLENLHHHYLGYQFTERLQKMCNPFSLLNHFSNHGEFFPYWHETNDSYLTSLLRIGITTLNALPIPHEDLRNSHSKEMETLRVLYSSGYLTITDYADGSYTLGFPNLEATTALATALLKRCLRVPYDRVNALFNRLPVTLTDGDIDGTLNVMRQYLAAIPQDSIKEIENYYATMVFIIFSILHIDFRCELWLDSGRMDVLVESTKFIHCLKFALDETAEEAMSQINTSQYHVLRRWENSKKLIKTGVSFDGNTYNIRDWKYTVSS